jgi:predicted nucleic acid-binding protein
MDREVGAPVEGVTSHHKDDWILATAVSAEADILVTGDAQILAIGQYENILIANVRNTLSILDDPSDSFDSADCR